MARHRIKLSNGALLVIEEHDNELAIRDNSHGEDWWVATISRSGFQVATNSSDAVDVLSYGLKENSDSLSTFTIKHTIRNVLNQNNNTPENRELSFAAEDFAHAIDQLFDYYRSSGSFVTGIDDYTVSNLLQNN